MFANLSCPCAIDSGCIQGDAEAPPPWNGECRGMGNAGAGAGVRAGVAHAAQPPLVPDLGQDQGSDQGEIEWEDVIAVAPPPPPRASRDAAAAADDLASRQRRLAQMVTEASSCGVPVWLARRDYGQDAIDELLRGDGNDDGRRRSNMRLIGNVLYNMWGWISSSGSDDGAEDGAAVTEAVSSVTLPDVSEIMRSLQSSNRPSVMYSWWQSCNAARDATRRRTNSCDGAALPASGRRRQAQRRW